MEINFENFIKFNIQVGTIVDVKENKKAKNFLLKYNPNNLPTKKRK